MLHILVVDDEDDFRSAYQSLLQGLGYTCELAATTQEARAALQNHHFDVVLLDLRLQKQEQASGLDLLQDGLCTGAKVFLITGYADTSSVEAAYKAGAYDYLVKNYILDTLLTAKLRHLEPLVRARRAQMPVDEAKIRELWADLKKGTSQEKGRRLEELIFSLMTAIPGFKEAWRNLKTPTEEIDGSLRNESTDPFWAKVSGYFLLEGKNWSKKVGTPEVAWFGDKLRARRSLAAWGFFFAPEGFSEPVEEKLRTLRQEGLIVVPLDRPAIQALIDSTDRNETLKNLCNATLR